MSHQHKPGAAKAAFTNFNVNKIFDPVLLAHYWEWAKNLSTSSQCPNDDAFWIRCESLADQMVWEANVRMEHYGDHKKLIERVRLTLFYWAVKP